MNPTTGFRVKRLSRSLSIQQLSDLSGLSPYIIRHCENGDMDRISMSRVITLANALDITIDEGCRVHFAASRRQRSPRHDPRNVLEAYMAHKGLTLHGMATILDTSIQTASIQCAKSTPAVKYVKRLAAEEDLSVSDFIEMYSAMVYI